MSSLDSAAAILACFSAETPELAVSAVSKQLGMPKSTVSRLMRAMVEHAFLEQDPDTQRFRVGVQLFQLGQLYHTHANLLDMADAETVSLVQETGFTAYLGVMRGTDIVILRRRHGGYPVRMVLEPGIQVAAADTAFGKALLARLNDSELTALLPPVLVNERTDTRRPIGDFLKEIALVRKQGWARAQETFPGIMAVGAAVGSASNQPAVGFALSFPTNAVPKDEQKSIVDRVLACAQRIAAKSGDPFYAHRLAKSAKGNPMAPQIVTR
ncbi:IclR family transcriptional regulator [Ferrovibrio sp.]|uniref:IclR family transcriptional regulator n=1 Tax=Ferrovibrio sp. TaxID=1917215 RepID=UPI0035B41676